jgi:hypothetical protein
MERYQYGLSAGSYHTLMSKPSLQKRSFSGDGLGSEWKQRI